MRPLEAYLRDLRSNRSYGVAETSGYGILATLLNDVGASLSPKVHCSIHPRSQGAGIPDGGLYTWQQLPKDSNEPLDQRTLPARGVIEVKGTHDNVQQTATSDQIQRYVSRYGQVLVTNYRDFLLVGRNRQGQPHIQEQYHLANSEHDFWSTPIDHLVETHNEGLCEYLKRVMLPNAPLTKPQDLAWFLASYARDARRWLSVADVQDLVQIRAALEQSLGITFQGQEGDTFFRSTLVQTLFYGMFAAWVLWHNEQPNRTDEFRWREAGYYLHVPVLQALFEEVAQSCRLQRLQLGEVFDRTGATLNRVERDVFFTMFESGYAVQYFYEPFLNAFDPQLRKQLGVWYTPPEVVQYMVARVHTVLREELGIADGLADRHVYVLDPCCGTGAYLAEVLRCIGQVFRDKGDEALLGEEVKWAAQHRVFGFELMPAPFVVAHLQISLLLQVLGNPFGDKERAGVYLTNALTGWSPSDEAKERVIQLALTGLAELKDERDAARHVKRDIPILVILGNPPYNAYAGVSPEEEERLVEPYKEGLISQWGIKKFNLDDLYVRFFRLAERKIAEMQGKGIVCYISNYSWVSEPSFVVLRQHLLNTFDRFWIENMHGNRKISEYAPDGKTSETIFAIRGFSAGIKQGTVISLWLKDGKKHDQKVLYRDDINAAKAEERRAQLLRSLQTPDFNSQYARATPSSNNRYSFRPANVAAHYLTWTKLTDLCEVAPSNGLMEKRKGALIDLDRDALRNRMMKYYDPHVAWEDLAALGTGLTIDAARFDAQKARAKVLAREPYQEDRLRRYTLRPFDNRWCYYTLVRPLWNETRPTLWAQCWAGNQFLISRSFAVASPEGIPLSYTTLLGDNGYLRGLAYYFPLQLRHVPTPLLHPEEQAETAIITANLSPLARNYLATLDITTPDADAATATLLWMHALAIGYAPCYLHENMDGIRQDWLRIPLPQDREVLLQSATLGRQVAALLDTEHTVPGVDMGSIRAELRIIAVPSRVGGGSFNIAEGDLDLRAGWGYAGQGGITMPGKGRVEPRPYTPDEQQAMGTAMAVLGATTYDIALNTRAYWHNIPQRVWDYTLGGYQVIKKWLSYREFELLGRSLMTEEVREVQHMSRRIAALVLLEPELDANYAAVKRLA